MLKRLGPFRIEKRIGRGGMGTVYAAVHEETGERVAVKVLTNAVAEESNLRLRFATEIESLKTLRHPNIVRLIGDGFQDGQPYYVMELVDGCSLQDELNAGRRYAWYEVVQIGIQVCLALKHAHDHGIIHRDLKPANLLRAPDRRIKLTDFGIAKCFGADQLTAAGSVVGTADFMAPEQAERLAATYRSDLYSLGAVLFTLLTQRTPFSSESLPRVIYKLCHEPAPRVRTLAPQTPLELEQIVDQLLQKDPAARIPTALAVANRLHALMTVERLSSVESSLDSGTLSSDDTPVPGDSLPGRAAADITAPNAPITKESPASSAGASPSGVRQGTEDTIETSLAEQQSNAFASSANRMPSDGVKGVESLSGSKAGAGEKTPNSPAQADIGTSLAAAPPKPTRLVPSSLAAQVTEVATRHEVEKQVSASDVTYVPRTPVPLTSIDPGRPARTAVSGEQHAGEAVTEVSAVSLAQAVPAHLQSGKSSTVADSSTANRFRRVEADRVVETEKQKRGWGWRELEVGLLALALAGAIFVIVYILQPPTADQLYSRIVRNKQDLEVVKGQIDHFLEAFPEDSRAEEIRGYERDVRSEWLVSRIRIKRDPSLRTPCETLFLRAMQERREGRPAAAQQLFLELIELPIQRPLTSLSSAHGEPTKAQSSASEALDQDCRELAQHQLMRLHGGG